MGVAPGILAHIQPLDCTSCSRSLSVSRKQASEQHMMMFRLNYIC